jgi:hypothetical protein
VVPFGLIHEMPRVRESETAGAVAGPAAVIAMQVGEQDEVDVGANRLSVSRIVNSRPPS